MNLDFICNCDSGELKTVQSAVALLPDCEEKTVLLQAVEEKLQQLLSKPVLRIEFDPCSLNPLDPAEKSWHVISFSRKHINYEDPGQWLDCDGERHDELIELLKTGKAWILSYFEHGDGYWFLRGTGFERGLQCRWDTAQTVGILFADPDWEESEENPSAPLVESILNEYNDWCNGNCYYYCIEDDCENMIDSCGGYIGKQSLKECLQSEHPELFDGDELKNTVIVKGEAAFLFQ